ncbi:MAG: class I SAM-dependent methyltransferase [Gammaproteobacteria bacterium]|nr:class I SAM-dependent methyltransferase [Gammaproteobacteria bacterium]
MPAEEGKEQTDFGYQRVSPEEKTRRVRGVFESVASRYDLMNDLMSGGLHRLWKRFALACTGLRPGMRALDLAGGTGDLARALAGQVGAEGEVVLADINAAMLARGRERLLNAGLGGRVTYSLADAEALPFARDHFDCTTIAFGLRNVTEKSRALSEMLRVLAPGGRALILEFSRPYAPLRTAYDAYSFGVLPRLGRWVAGDEASYRYLAESIRRHPAQEELMAMMTGAGFENVRYHNLAGGIVALHMGWKP